jgi:hypothetical protein
VIFGEPDIDILKTADGQFQVKVNGVDVFHPNTGEVRSDGAEGIASWFVDTDYNEESFFVRHAYFLGANDPYKSLKTTLKAEINEEAWATLNSDISRPLPLESNALNCLAQLLERSVNVGFYDSMHRRGIVHRCNCRRQAVRLNQEVVTHHQNQGRDKLLHFHSGHHRTFALIEFDLCELHLLSDQLKFGHAGLHRDLVANVHAAEPAPRIGRIAPGLITLGGAGRLLYCGCRAIAWHVAHGQHGVRPQRPRRVGFL